MDIKDIKMKCMELMQMIDKHMMEMDREESDEPVGSMEELKEVAKKKMEMPAKKEKKGGY